MRSAASSEETVPQQLLSPMQSRPGALQQADAVLATTRQPVHMAMPFGIHSLPGVELTWMTDQAITTLMSVSLILSRTPIRIATRKQMPTGIALCHSDRVSGWLQHSGMIPSGRLQSRQCWRLCRQT